MTDQATKTTGAQHLSMDNFKSTIDSAGDKPVLVDFYADWCGPCKLAAPIIDKLSGEYADKAIIAKLDTDEARDIAVDYGVMSIPTVIVFKGGKEIDRKIGFGGEQGYRDLLTKALSS